MLLDLPRVEYIDKDKKKIKKSDLEFVKEQNKKIKKGGLTLSEIMGYEKAQEAQAAIKKK